MYKVYISRVPNMELDQKVRTILRENGFQCEDWKWRNVASDADIHKALKEADVYLCYSSDEVNSHYEKRETDMALYNNTVFIAVRLCATDRMCGGWAMVNLPSSVAVFDLEDESSLKDLPGFIMERIRMSAKGDHGSGDAGNGEPGEPYGGEKDYLYVSFADEDRARAYRMICNLQSKGYRVWYDNGGNTGKRDHAIPEKIRGCCCMIALISPRYMDSESCKNEISMAKELDQNCLLVYLEKTKMSPGMAMRLHRLQAIHQYSFGTEQEFYDELYSAGIIKPAK